MARILVVDDEIEVLTLLVEILEMEGYEVHRAMSGTEALALVDRHVYDAILTDLAMPGLDGISLYRELSRRRPELSNRVAFTGARLDSMERLRDVGLPILPKPFHLEDVRGIMRQLVGG